MTDLITEIEKRDNTIFFKYDGNLCSLQSETIDDSTYGYILRYGNKTTVEWGAVDKEPFIVIPKSFTSKKRFIQEFKEKFGFDLDSIRKTYKNKD